MPTIIKLPLHTKTEEKLGYQPRCQLLSSKTWLVIRSPWVTFVPLLLISNPTLAEYCVVLPAVIITEWLPVLDLILSEWIAFGSYFQIRKEPMNVQQRDCWIHSRSCIFGWLWTHCELHWVLKPFPNFKSNCPWNPFSVLSIKITIKLWK